MEADFGDVEMKLTANRQIVLDEHTQSIQTTHMNDRNMIILDISSVVINVEFRAIMLQDNLNAIL